MVSRMKSLYIFHELTPGQYECSVSSGGSPTRQRARTVGAAGGDTMKRSVYILTDSEVI